MHESLFMTARAPRLLFRAALASLVTAVASLVFVKAFRVNALAYLGGPAHDLPRQILQSLTHPSMHRPCRSTASTARRFTESGRAQLYEAVRPDLRWTTRSSGPPSNGASAHNGTMVAPAMLRRRCADTATERQRRTGRQGQTARRQPLQDAEPHAGLKARGRTVVAPPPVDPPAPPGPHRLSLLFGL